MSHQSGTNDERPLPYARHQVEESDIEAVVEVLRSDWLTTGPQVELFERDVAAYVGSNYAVAVSNGTAALHAAFAAAGIGPGDEVIFPAMTFVATANAARFLGATPIPADVFDDTLLLDPESVERAVTSRSRAVIAVDYAGQPCDYDGLHQVAERHGLRLLADSSHALGAADGSRRVGTCADLTTFSFHPVKPITSGEGGMVTTDDRELADRMRQFRNHGIALDHHQRKQQGTWRYEMTTLGFNYRLPDIACALGRSQLARLDQSIERRNLLAAAYDARLRDIPGAVTVRTREGVRHGRHLFVVRIPGDGTERDRVFSELRARNLGVNVHYRPVHLHPYYRAIPACRRPCPVAEQAGREILSLPLYPEMTVNDVNRVCDALDQVTSRKQQTAA